ncbi:hypothetical protein CPB84DRAFT_1769211 [Gymnopilus junonius]|uniref:Uncharacterized protein n=1 Tax=Gymnopilus junonius TaxID=109634 RepID=A0A9P5TS54_GYMJU|nr:hypothetical protein CPB84DRAFT_1795743 [Gymnopilus junonius]KAF8907005.1 hypothetical protein CPB84DRAFT_1769211 [Gymnopilus junonius]
MSCVDMPAKEKERQKKSSMWMMLWKAIWTWALRQRCKGRDSPEVLRLVKYKKQGHRSYSSLQIT